MSKATLYLEEPIHKAQNKDGSWSQAGISHGPINTHMSTCLAALMLEVYYRFLPGTGSK